MKSFVEGKAGLLAGIIMVALGLPFIPARGVLNNPLLFWGAILILFPKAVIIAFGL